MRGRVGRSTPRWHDVHHPQKNRTKFASSPHPLMSSPDILEVWWPRWRCGWRLDPGRGGHAECVWRNAGAGRMSIQGVSPGQLPDESIGHLPGTPTHVGGGRCHHYPPPSAAGSLRPRARSLPWVANRDRCGSNLSSLPDEQSRRVPVLAPFIVPPAPSPARPCITFTPHAGVWRWPEPAREPMATVAPGAAHTVPKTAAPDPYASVAGAEKQELPGSADKPRFAALPYPDEAAQADWR